MPKARNESRLGSNADLAGTERVGFDGLVHGQLQLHVPSY